MSSWLLPAAAACVLVCASAQAEDAEARKRFEAELGSVYDYLPSDVTQDVRNAKVAQMDRFWDFVKSDPATYVPMLREALRDPKRNAYFFFDGAGLLLEVAKEPADVQLAADAASRCRVKDVGKGYFYFCRELAKRGADIAEATANMLSDPTYAVIVPQHAMRMQQADCVRLCLFLTPEETWVPKFSQRLAVEKDETATKTILRCLADAATKDAGAAVRVFAESPKTPPALAAYASRLAKAFAPSPDTRKPSTTRAQFETFLASCEAEGRVPYEGDSMRVRADAQAHVLSADAPRLRTARRLAARRVSDEGLIDILFFTQLLHRAVASEK